MYLKFEILIDFTTSLTPFFYRSFNGKEKDYESGYHYYGSRYYNSELSMWLSVDPMSDKYPSLTPYNYCANNPVKFIDPNGEEIDPASKKQWNEIECIYSQYRILNSLSNPDRDDDVIQACTEIFKIMKLIEKSSQVYSLTKSDINRTMMLEDGTINIHILMLPVYLTN